MSFDYSSRSSDGSGSDMIIQASNSGIRQQAENPKGFSLNEGLTWKRIAKIALAIGLGIGICGFISDVMSGRAEIWKKSTPNLPCKIDMVPYRYKFEGLCTSEEIDKGYEDYLQFMREYDAKRTIEIRKEVDEEIRKDREKTDAFFAKNDEAFRRINNPTPEERAEDLEIINQRLDERYKGFAGYVPRSNQAAKPEVIPCDSTCQELARKALNVNSDADCRDIQRQYRKLSLETHTDKPFGNKDKFLEISDAYDKLCQNERRRF